MTTKLIVPRDEFARAIAGLVPDGFTVQSILLTAGAAQINGIEAVGVKASAPVEAPVEVPTEEPAEAPVEASVEAKVEMVEMVDAVEVVPAPVEETVEDPAKDKPPVKSRSKARKAKGK